MFQHLHVFIEYNYGGAQTAQQGSGGYGGYGGYGAAPAQDTQQQQGGYNQVGKTH